MLIATICLNEMEWLPKLYEQHRDWPGLQRWVFVEASDGAYADVNPKMVSRTGGSVDGTRLYLEELARADDRVDVCYMGTVRGDRPDQTKCLIRNEYMRMAYDQDWVLVLDADEFYCKDMQQELSWTMKEWKSVAPYRHEMWNGWDREAVGGFFSIPHLRAFRFRPGMRYVDNHNVPNGCPPPAVLTGIEYFHTAWMSKLGNRVAKRRYYDARGEGHGDGRGWYQESRAAWEEGRVVHGARIVPYNGPVPECFR